MTLDPPALQPGPAPDQALACRAGCGACCIAPAISSAIPGMPHGKPAGVHCVQLDDALRCRVFGQPGRPAVWRQLRPALGMCGPVADNGGRAMRYLAQLERATRTRPA